MKRQTPRKHRKYYEAIIQLRPASNKIIKFVKAMIEEKEDVFISREERLKTGIDLYISSKNLAMTIGSRLKKRFGGKVILSRSIYGVQKASSKRLYRLTVCYREEPSKDL